MRIAIGQLMEESNTFVRQQADLDHFRNNQLLLDDDVVTRLRGTRAEVGGFLDALGRAGVDVVPTVAANCVSSGAVPRETFEALKGEILKRLAAVGPLDGVLLALHGAIVLDDAPDGEGELLTAVREQVGPRVPLVATLDFHATITPRMVEESGHGEAAARSRGAGAGPGSADGVSRRAPLGAGPASHPEAGGPATGLMTQAELLGYLVEGLVSHPAPDRRQRAR